MKKVNNSKLITEYTKGQFKTELWWNDETKQFDVWRNKKVVKNFSYKGYVLFEDMVEAAKSDFQCWFDETEHDNITLNEYLKRNNIQLTKIELKSLNTIFGEGSFYEEGACYDDNNNPYADRKYGSFIGWYIDEKECPGCRGALASLVKKGILGVGSDEVNNEEQATYYIYFTPEFKTEQPHYYHELKIEECNLK